MVVFIEESPGNARAADDFLDELLAGIGLRRDQVLVTSLVREAPPDNRSPEPAEIESSRSWLHEQIAGANPRVVCTLGNFATKALRGDPTGIASLHGRAEDRQVAGQEVKLLPLFHPAAALYRDELREVLRADFARIPELLVTPGPAQLELF